MSTTRKTHGRYYTRAARIELVPGVRHQKCDERTDLYAGQAEALQQSGVLRLDMLPPAGSNMITWRPEGERQGHESWFNVPGYITISRHPKEGFRVLVTVSREERVMRREEEQARKREAAEQWKHAAEQWKRQPEREAEPVATTKRRHLTLVWSAP